MDPCDDSRLIALQERVRVILTGVEAFQEDVDAGTQAWPIITEKIGDVEAQLEQALQEIGFGVTVLLAEGPPHPTRKLPAHEGIYVAQVDLVVAVTVAPLMAPEVCHSAIAEMCIRAIHGRPVDPDADDVLDDSDVFEVVHHETSPEARERDVALHRIFVRAFAVLPPITLNPIEEPDP